MELRGVINKLDHLVAQMIRNMQTNVYHLDNRAT